MKLPNLQETQLNPVWDCLAFPWSFAVLSQYSDRRHTHPHPAALYSQTSLARDPEISVLDLEQFLFPLVHRIFQVSTESDYFLRALIQDLNRCVLGPNYLILMKYTLGLLSPLHVLPVDKKMGTNVIILLCSVTLFCARHPMSNTLMEKNVACSFFIKCCQSATSQIISVCNIQHYTFEYCLCRKRGKNYLHHLQ